jgi:hypothetical protein
MAVLDDTSFLGLTPTGQKGGSKQILLFYTRKESRNRERRDMLTRLEYSDDLL